MKFGKLARTLFWVLGTFIALAIICLTLLFGPMLYDSAMYGPIVYILEPNSNGFYLVIQGTKKGPSTKFWSKTEIDFGNNSVIEVPDLDYAAHWRKQWVEDVNGQRMNLADLSQFTYTGAKQLFFLNNGTDTRIKWNCYYVGVTKPPSNVEEPPRDLINKAEFEIGLAP